MKSKSADLLDNKDKEAIMICENEKFTDEDKKLIHKAMSRHFLFRELSKNIM
jgi:hypothetical protein